MEQNIPNEMDTGMTQELGVRVLASYTTPSTEVVVRVGCCLVIPWAGFRHLAATDSFWAQCVEASVFRVYCLCSSRVSQFWVIKFWWLSKKSFLPLVTTSQGK